MTDPTYTHLTLVIDRSGSMAERQADAQGGIDTLLAEQRAAGGRMTLTLAEFDDQYHEAVRMLDIQQVPGYRLVPRGSTALYDAFGRAITATGEDLAALPEDQRPGNVLVTVVTDGFENASREWTFDTLQRVIEEQKVKFGWQFSFIGVGEIADVGRRLGTQSVTTTGRSGAAMRHAFLASSAATSTLRGGGAYEMPDGVPDKP